MKMIMIMKKMKKKKKRLFEVLSFRLHGCKGRKDRHRSAGLRGCSE